MFGTERSKTMRIFVNGKNIEISEYLFELTDKKVRKLDKFFPDDAEAFVTLAVEKNRHIAEVTIRYKGGFIRGEEATLDMYASIDNVLEKLEKQIVKHRTKLEKDLRAGVFNTLDTADYEDDEEEAKIVRVKRFDIKPMTVEEAMLQMEMLNHSFYVFTNGETGEVNVLYKRKDGNFGLIEPE